ncbi:response regulator [Pararhizobium sp.]|uniref:response regulator n=1 Tax=Pararhizobium sp. TaxID=1977563 RepID=UPI003D11AD2E
MTALASPILVFEDEPLIALDIEDMLNQAGYENLTLLTTCAAGHEFLANHTPAVAIVDISLKDGDCTDLVRVLVSRNVPVIVASGTNKTDADEIFTQSVWIAKPWNPFEFIAAVAKALEQPTLKQGRRPRGGSARGEFEQSKREADLIIGSSREAEQHKTELLRALRLTRDGGTTD